jgi:hypothetical protein
LLQSDYGNAEAHELVLQVFHELGFKNQIVIEGKLRLKEIMLASLKA